MKSRIQVVRSELLEAIANEYDRMIDRCESPMEKMLLAATLAPEAYCAYIDLNIAPAGIDEAVDAGFVHDPFSNIPAPYPVARVYHNGFLYQQPVLVLPDRKIRMDFAIIGHRARTAKISIEVDGHDFHERTKEQARRDKSRDRLLQAMGWAVIRITGSEIYQDVDSCVSQILDVYWDRLV